MKILEDLKEIIAANKHAKNANWLKKKLFDHHKRIVTSIMEESPVLQIIRKADLQTHNLIADEESTLIEIYRSDLL